MKLAVNGFWPRGHGAKDVGHTDVGRCLALLGSVGRCAFAHGHLALERPREVWAAWRALLFPSEVRMLLLCEQNTLTRILSRTLICPHAPAWLKVLQRVSHKNMFIHMSFKIHNCGTEPCLSPAPY